MENTTPDDDAPLDPAAMLALSERQLGRMDAIATRPVAVMLGTWGIAWLAGFFVLWSGYPQSHSPLSIPLPLAAVIFSVLIVAAIVLSAIVGARIGRGTRGASRFSGLIYGITWPIAGAAVALLGVGLSHNGMPADLTLIYYPAAYSLMVGLLYLAGAALWRAPVQLILGVWILAVGTAAPFAGAPGNLLVMSIAGGGGFALGAIAVALQVGVGQRRG
jgi:hypothetical protein